ncbi:MAG: hypothetical protein KZQ80_09685 [Candidatus Thiodiazotropha sp. (ex Monitilora ramsayi)]|nr:hypothetical protein [Candidatus Thiodiazotropha sp. (ex Monitilora ramsayi)]
MNDSLKVLHLSLLLAMTAPVSNAMAESNIDQAVDRDQLQAAVTEEVKNDGHQFSNESEADRLRHRVNEQEREQTRSEEQNELKKQMKHQFQHRFQYEDRTAGQGFNSGGSMSRGGGPRGGAGSGGGGRR